jgi:AcrR family transcriptional regulator
LWLEYRILEAYLQITTKKTLTPTEISTIYKKFSIFGKDYELPLNKSRCRTKQEIMLVSTVLFSQKGYHNVSTRDIAKVIGIKTPSIYNHFKSKEEIWEKALQHTMKLFLLYIREIDNALKSKNKIKDMLDVVFYEPKRMLNIFPCYAFGVIQRERIYNAFAGKLFNAMGKHTVKILTRHFQRCSDINPEINLDSISMICMFSVFFGINSKVSNLLDNTGSYDFAELFNNIQKILLLGSQA